MPVDHAASPGILKIPDRVKLMHTPAAFMPLLPDTDVDAGLQRADREDDDAADETRTSTLTPRALDDWTFSFFAQLHLDPDTTRTFTHTEQRHTTLLRTLDGSTTTVTETDDGAEVTRTGPRDLWAPIEQAHRLWQDVNRPRREWFTLDVGPTGQHVRLAAPDGRAYTWAL
ncbi:hypothetical protein [Embleya sp. NBC_00896]|uniref:hypothetical protein n=1 Tax=Embleya sp. NBC_00896 TaxID=2975961 RepID=UPI002F91387A|nr:hypothetical protein OG928_45230 [Embleya sp. NBC_00896]